MLYEIIIEQEALSDLQNIFNYITEQDSKTKALKFTNKLKEEIKTLTQMPQRCRESIYTSDRNTHDFIVSGYTIVFQIRDTKLHLLTVFRQRSY